MSVTVRLTSERKGSNPGGRCEISDGFGSFSAYFKYCYGAHIGNGEISSFNAHNQPVYEALTVELAKIFGLKVPETFVLLNRNRDVEFHGWKEHREKDPSGREYYFVSKMVPNPKSTEDNPREREALDSDRPYLNALLISDIEGKRQNYAFTPDGSYGGRITYLDLGCSFVHATGGHLKAAHKLRIGVGKDFKKAMKKLNGKKVLSRDGSMVVGLAELIEGVGEIPIPVLSARKAFLDVWALISGDEIHEIQRYLAQGFINGWAGLRNSGYSI